LNVRQVMVPGSLYIEGSYSYVRIEQNGREVLERRLSVTKSPQASIALEPGSYRLVSYQRPCDGNCGLLDPPTDQCDSPIEAAGGAVVETTVRVSPGHGCEIVAG
jgi:hypothetical protein